MGNLNGSRHYFVEKFAKRESGIGTIFQFLSILFICSGLTYAIVPRDITSFTNSCRGNSTNPSPRQIDGNLVFNGVSGGQQLDPQVAVGGGYVFNATNTGVVLFTKEGELVGGGSPSCLNGGIDPKIFYDVLTQRFVYASLQMGSGEVRVAVSKTSDPTKGWWAYSIPVPGWRDGGAVGGNKHWIVYSYPGSGGQNMFIMDKAKVMAGEELTVKTFPGQADPGQPVFTYDADQENLYFVKLAGSSLRVNYIDASGAYKTQASVNHGLGHSYPTPFRQRGGATCSAGDINAKIAALRNGFIWTADAVTTNTGGRTRTSARFYQIDLTGKVIQTGMVDDPTGEVFSGQVTIAVNKLNDVLLVFQQSSASSYISSRMAYRLASDPSGTLRPVVHLAEGEGANTSTAAWGDYSGASVDGDNELDLWGVNSVASSSGRGNSTIFQLKSEVLPISFKASNLLTLSVRQANGVLYLKDLGLTDKSRIELFDLKGVRLLAQPVKNNKNDLGEVAVPTAKLPKGPAFLRLLKEENKTDSLRVVIMP